MDAGAAYRLVTGFLRTVVHVFFRRVEVSGLANVPETGGGILVAWHPNGLVDPGLILTHFPRRVVFGARHGLFSVPLLGTLMRTIGTVPIYRAQDGKSADPDARKQANRASLDALAGAVAGGSFSCLFPEGTSHDASRPLEVKMGAAYLYYQARQMGGERLVIIPVGLHYDHKRVFRSEAHVIFHPPLELSAALDVTPEPGQEKALARELTDAIERALHETAHATETWALHYLIRRTRKLIRAERAARAGVDLGKPRMKERTRGFERVLVGYRQRLSESPEVVEALAERVGSYDRDLRALGLEDFQLDRSPPVWSKWWVFMLVLQVVLVFFLMPPLILVGLVVNVPTMLAVWLFTRGVAQKKKDEATLKVLVGILALPLTWLVAGLLAWWASEQLNGLFPGLPDAPLLAALSIVTLGAVGGFLSLRYLELSRATWAAVRVRLTRARRKRAIQRLLLERGALFEQVMALAQGLELPGAVHETGRIMESGDSLW